MKIYTKRGDEGQTDLFGGARVSKANSRVRAYGAIDLANSAVGIAATAAQGELAGHFHHIMSDLFDVGAELATAPKDGAQRQLQAHLDTCIDDARVSELELLIDKAETHLAPLKTFVLPTGCELAARLHMARTLVRQAEQEVVQLLDDGHDVRGEVVRYLNRLSDLLFVWARLANHEAGVADTPWAAKKDRTH